MSLHGRGYREDEVMQALAGYLEVMESGRDGEAFLRQHAAIEPELRALANLDASLRTQVPEEAFTGLERSRGQFHAAIRDDDTTTRALAWFKPRLFGIIGAIGLGVGLTGAFASGALPSHPITEFIGSLPVVGHASTEPPPKEILIPPGGSKPGLVEHQPLPFTERQESTPAADPVSESATPFTDASHEGPQTVQPETPRDDVPPGQGVENPAFNGVSNGAEQTGTAPSQAGTSAGASGLEDGTPPGQGGSNPGQGLGPPDDPGNPGHGLGPPDDPGSQGSGPPDDPGSQGSGPPDDPGSQGSGPPDDPGSQGSGPPDDPGSQGSGPPDDPGSQGSSGPPDDAGSQGSGPPDDPGSQGNRN